MARAARPTDARGHIRQRGRSFQVLVYAGIDPVTARTAPVTETAHDEREGSRAHPAAASYPRCEQRIHARTKATLAQALDSWLTVHEAEANTLAGYEANARRYIKPVLGDVAVGKITDADAGGVLRAAAPLPRRAATDVRSSSTGSTASTSAGGASAQRRPGRPPAERLSAARLRRGRMPGHRVRAARLPAAVAGDDPPDPHHRQRRARRRGALGLDQDESSRHRTHAAAAGTPARPAVVEGGGADHRRGVGAGRRLGHARLVDHGHRDAPR